MLDQEGFNRWTEKYDGYVQESDEAGTYPFAGYRQVLAEIAGRVLAGPAHGKTFKAELAGYVTEPAPRVLDLGFGTATLTSYLYEQGCRIYGQDFSEKMLAVAQQKMPQARLFLGDFAEGLDPAIRAEKYDAIIATYAFHHLDDGQKAALIRELLPLLAEGGHLYIGDIAFRTRAELEKCREEAGADWDDDEIYWVYEEMKAVFPELAFTPFSFCGGALEL